VLIDGDVLGMHPGAQTVHIEGSGPVFASYGRTTDAIAWLARSDYVQVGLADGAVTSNVIAAAADDTTTSSGRPLRRCRRRDRTSGSTSSTARERSMRRCSSRPA
jgi:hypothetical protein